MNVFVYVRGCSACNGLTFLSRACFSALFVFFFICYYNYYRNNHKWLLFAFSCCTQLRIYCFVILNIVAKLIIVYYFTLVRFTLFLSAFFFFVFRCYLEFCCSYHSVLSVRARVYVWVSDMNEYEKRGADWKCMPDWPSMFRSLLMCSCVSEL